MSLGEALGFGPRLCRGYGTGDDSRCPPWARMRSCLPARPHHAARHELHRKHPRSAWKDPRRKYCDAGWWPGDGETALFNPAVVRATATGARGPEKRAGYKASTALRADLTPQRCPPESDPCSPSLPAFVSHTWYGGGAGGIDSQL